MSSKRNLDDDEQLNSSTNKDNNIKEIRNVKPKLTSVIAKVSNPPRNYYNNPKPNGFNVDSNHNHINKSNVDVISNVDSIQRNKRLFAGLIGHLGSAKKRLEEDSTVIVKQIEISSTVSKKHVIEGKKIAMTSKIIKETERQKELILKEKLHIKQSIDEINKYAEKFNVVQEKFQSFLLTKTDKPIFWLPKAHNKNTAALLRERIKEVTQIIGEREVVDKNELVKLENQLEELNKKEEELLLGKDEKIKSIEVSIEEELNEKNQENDVILPINDSN